MADRWEALFTVWRPSHVSVVRVVAEWRERIEADVGPVAVRAVLTGQRETRYQSRRTGKFVGVAAWRRWPGKIVARHRREWELQAQRKRAEEWEVTVKYRSVKRGNEQVVSVTVRVRVPPEHVPATEAEVRNAAWRAVSQGARSLTQFAVRGVDWRRAVTDRRGQTRTYTSTGDPEDLASFRPLFFRVGKDKLRVAKVRGT